MLQLQCVSYRSTPLTYKEKIVMAKKGDTHSPSCPWRSPPATLARRGEKSAKQACKRRGDGEGWPFDRDMRGGNHASGVAAMSASRPVKEESYEAPRKKKAG